MDMRRVMVTVVAAVVTVYGGGAAAFGQVIPAAPMLGQPKNLSGLSAVSVPTIIVGSPAIPDFPTAFDAINGNSPDSPLAGVVSVYGAITATNGALGSGVALDRYHILTAAHVVDFLGGVTPEGAVTGDGVPDALMPLSRVYLNVIAAPDPIRIDAIQVAPGWTGFRNAGAVGGASNHNDLAIVTLHEALPESVPTYGIYRTPFDQDFARVILMTGYGGGGNAVGGITQPASFDIKRYGWNVAATYETNAAGTRAELYLADFDAPNALGDPDVTHTGFDGITSLGNDFEATIAPGDSGGPSFVVNDLNGDGNIEANELSVFGLTTFTFDTFEGSWPGFGSAFGGPILSAYAGFVDGIVAAPEPGTGVVLALGVWVVRRRRGRGVTRN